MRVTCVRFLLPAALSTFARTMSGEQLWFFSCTHHEVILHRTHGEFPFTPLRKDSFFPAAISDPTSKTCTRTRRILPCQKHTSIPSRISSSSFRKRYENVTRFFGLFGPGITQTGRMFLTLNLSDGGRFNRKTTAGH